MILPNLGIALSALAAFALLGIGALALVAPERLAQAYGLPVREGNALGFVRATGARDAILGAAILATAARHDLFELAIFAALGILLSAFDLAIAYAHLRRMRRELLAHLGGVVGFSVLLIILIAGMR
uniref:DUF4267 domain-containing protein n=1 Tax=mine drainage metagenome TaxID=410659 RepID=E6PGY2_9ZZZZ